jgi:hypothetical protein
MDGLFPNIFHGEGSELREKYGLDTLPFARLPGVGGAWVGYNRGR